MKPTYDGFSAKRNSGFAQLPPVGAYVAQIQGVKVEKSYSGDRDLIAVMLEITEGEYKGQYHKVFEEQRSSFGDNVKYKGVLRLTPPLSSDDPWVKSRFEGNLWCVEQSNPGYTWDWDENKLKGKVVGINVRKNFYPGRDGELKETTEIAQFETVDDVRSGKCKALKDRKPKGTETVKQDDMTDVSGTVDVPF